LPSFVLVLSVDFKVVSQTQSESEMPQFILGHGLAARSAVTQLYYRLGEKAIISVGGWDRYICLLHASVVSSIYWPGSCQIKCQVCQALTSSSARGTL